MWSHEVFYHAESPLQKLPLCIHFFPFYAWSCHFSTPWLTIRRVWSIHGLHFGETKSVHPHLMLVQNFDLFHSIGVQKIAFLFNRCLSVLCFDVIMVIFAFQTVYQYQSTPGERMAHCTVSKWATHFLDTQNYLGVRQATSGSVTMASPVAWIMSACLRTCSWKCCRE